MQKKRKAAKDVFLEQQRNVDLDDEEFYPPEEALLGADELYEMEEIPAPAPEFTQNIATEGAVPLPQMAEPQQVLSNQEVDALLSGVSNAPVPPKSAPQMRKKMPKKNDNYIPSLDIKTSEELQLEKEAIKVRETGMLFWRRVIVPPNAFVVHTRINKADPITLGLGQSFRFNPNTDSYLVIPAAMQTIGVVANCISKEKQGINVLAYVQWQIDDFSIAYKKLDLTNTNDPLGIVNAQLREQAEAAIKDKIATMSVEEVLTDKAPVIEELTSRLRRVAEGQEGLGIKIITVQIREALVSSAALWNDLQSPYRNEQRQKARISQLEMENEINKKELETKKFKENRQAETNLEIEKTRQHKLTETTELRLQEESKRFEEEQKNIQHKQSLEEETVLKKKEQEDRLISKEREIQYKQEIEASDCNPRDLAE
ncbi:MAG: SPFH domain-containing protein [Spirochaetota bacterium]